MAQLKNIVTKNSTAIKLMASFIAVIVAIPFALGAVLPTLAAPAPIAKNTPDTYQSIPTVPAFVALRSTTVLVNTPTSNELNQIDAAQHAKDVAQELLDAKLAAIDTNQDALDTQQEAQEALIVEVPVQTPVVPVVDTPPTEVVVTPPVDTPVIPILPPIQDPLNGSTDPINTVIALL